MTYRFQSNAAGDVLMLRPDGDKVLSAMGREPADQGVIPPESMLGAIQAIEAALAREKLLQPSGRASDDAQRSEEEGEAVSLRQRAWPLVEMMRRAHAAGETIVWGG